MYQPEDRYRLLVDNLPDGFAYHRIVLDSDGVPVDYVFLEVNPAFEALTGLRREQLIGNRVTTVLPGLASSAFDWIGAYGRIALSGKTERFEQYSAPLGRWYEVVAYSDGPGYFVAVFHDVTDRRLMEAALRESERRFRSLFEQSLDATYLGTPEGRVVDVNQAWLDLFGYTREDLAQLNAAEFYADPAERDDFRRRMAETGVVKDEVRYRRKDGTVFICQRTQVALRDESGAVVAYQGINRDITDRRLADEALRASEQRFRLLFEQSMDAIFVVAPDGASIDANRASLDLFGYSREELPTFNGASLYADPADRQDFLRRIAATGFVKDEVRLKRKNGAVFDCERTVVALKDANGNVVAYQGVHHDVTARRLAGQRLVEANGELRDLAARLDAAREEERAAVAWELHNEVAQTLSALKMDVAMCRRHLSAGSESTLGPKLDEMTRLLDSTIARLRRLYTDLVPVMLEDLGLAAAIEWELEGFGRRTGVECAARHVDNVALPHARMALGLFRVLQEALENVRPHSGATRVTVDLERGGAGVVLRVVDNGRGFTEEEAKKPGALGLTGIRERVRSWGGDVDVHSSATEGTVFKVTVPLAG